MNVANHITPDPANDGLLELFAVGALSAVERTRVESELAAGAIPGHDLDSVYEGVIEVWEEVAAGMPAPRRSLRAATISMIQAEESPAPTKIVVRSDEGRWRPSGLPGIMIKLLFVDRERSRKIYLARIEPGSTYPDHRHSGVEELLLLEGDLQVDGIELAPGDFLLALPESIHRNSFTASGCLLYASAALDDEILH
jgi:hypothetical protein